MLGTAFRTLNAEDDPRLWGSKKTAQRLQALKINQRGANKCKMFIVTA
jgi:hypothetical protein